MATATLEDRTTTFSPTETGKRVGVTSETLANWRWKGEGPPYCLVGRRVRYRLVDLAAWLDERTRNSTSEVGSDA